MCRLCVCECVVFFVVYDLVDICDFVFVCDVEVDCFLDGEVDDEGYDEGVDQYIQCGDELYCELVGVFIDEQFGFCGEEVEVQGFDEIIDEVDVDDVE